jgi:hypothetical protein
MPPFAESIESKGLIRVSLPLFDASNDEEVVEFNEMRSDQADAELVPREIDIVALLRVTTLERSLHLSDPHRTECLTWVDVRVLG